MLEVNRLAEKNACTGCSACSNACAKNAIILKNDENGFKYPVIDMDACVSCGKCSRACPIINDKASKEEFEQIVYAAIGKDKSVVKTSSSGGIFPLLAKVVLGRGGVIYGCALDEKMQAFHMRATNEQELDSLKGSKYIQSDIGYTFRLVREDLSKGLNVLFVGTPCQVAGLLHYLDKRYDNLTTIDLVCHGVASYTFFKQYVEWYEKKYNVKVLEYKFRDKTKTDLGCVSQIKYSKNGKTKKEYTWYNEKYYYYYDYMLGKIFRESCYSCPYATTKRVADITLGDFWGITKLHPEIDVSSGMSVVILNSKSGQELFETIDVEKHISNLYEATLYNKSIVTSTSLTEERDIVLRLSRENSADKIAAFCKKSLGIKRYIYAIKRLIPVNVKRCIKSYINRR